MISINKQHSITIQQSNTFWQIKAFAVFTIFFAHMHGHEINGNSWMIDLFEIIGTIGVPIFLLISGFFNYSSKSSLKQNALNLFCPWLFWGTLCYILHLLKTPSDTPFTEWILFLLSGYSIFYFVPILFFCILLSRLMNDWALIFLGLTSQILTYYFDIIPYNSFWTFMFNPFNFVIYYIAGRLIHKYNVINHFKTLWFWISLCAFFLFLAFSSPKYQNPFTIIFTLSSFTILYLLFSTFTNQHLIKIGHFSFVIYLCHLQIAGFINTLYKPLWGHSFEITKTIVAFFAVSLFCFIVDYTLQKIQIPKFRHFLGFR